MINLTQSQITTLILSSFLLGVTLGVIYEAFCFFKFIFTVNGRSGAVFAYILTFLSDFIFCLLFVLTAILQSYRISGGIFRGISYLGILAGVLLYYFTLGKLTRKISQRLALFCRKTMRKILNLVSIPIRAIFSLIFKLYTLTIGKIIGKIIFRIKEKKHLRIVLQEKARLQEMQTGEINGGYKKEGRISFGGKRAT